MEKNLRAEEVARRLNCSTKTINYWYAAKKSNPNNELLQTLPEFIRDSGTGIRYWSEDDVEKLRTFQSTRPLGRNGIMGCVTQKYQRKRKQMKEDGE